MVATRVGDRPTAAARAAGESVVAAGFAAASGDRLLGAGAWALSLALWLGGCASIDRGPGVEAADLVLRGGNIITVDDRFSIAQSLAIRGEHIVAVGSDSDLERYVGAATRVVNLRGRTVIPGLIDGHLHNAGVVPASIWPLRAACPSCLRPSRTLPSFRIPAN